MTAQFHTSLIFRDDDGLPLTLISPLIYESAVLECYITVHAGFKTDLASIPKPFWNLLPPIGKYDRAAVVHDSLYQTGGYSRGDADRVMLEAMQVCGVPFFTRYTIYAGVRAGGWKAWNRYRASNAPLV